MSNRNQVQHRRSVEEIPIEMEKNLFVQRPAQMKSNTKRRLKSRKLGRPRHKSQAPTGTGDAYCDKLLARINDGNTLDYREVFTLKQKLGEGAFAKVYLAIHNESGKKCALKIISLKPEPATKKLNLIGNAKALKAQENRRKLKMLQQKVRILDNEVKIMKQISLLSLSDRKSLMSFELEDQIFANKNEIVLPLELLSGGELFDRLVKKERYTEKDAAQIFRRIVVGVKVLHQHGIVHRDMKPENLVFETEAEDARIKITDFGLSFRCYDDEDLFRKSIVGSPGYISPEILTRKLYSPACDIWALGCILFILVVGGPPFAGDTHEALFKNIKAGVYNYPTGSSVSNDAKDLIAKMLTVDPNLRITAPEIMKHPWLVKKTASADLVFGLQHLRAFNARKKLKNLAMKHIVKTKTPTNESILELLLDTTREGGFIGSDLVQLKEVLLSYTENETYGKITPAVFSRAFEEIEVTDLPTDAIFKVLQGKKDDLTAAEILIGCATVCKSWKGSEALKFCFEVFDSTGQGKISIKDMQLILSQSLGAKLLASMMVLFGGKKFISFSEMSTKISRFGPDWNIKENLKRTYSTAKNAGSRIFRTFSQMSMSGANRAGRMSSTLSLATIKSSISMIMPGQRKDEDYYRRISSTSSRSRTRSRGRSSSDFSRSYSLLNRASKQYKSRFQSTGNQTLNNRLSRALYKMKPKKADGGSKSTLSLNDESKDILEVTTSRTSLVMLPSERQKTKKKVSTSMMRKKTRGDELLSDFVDPKSFLFHKNIHQKRSTMMLRHKGKQEPKKVDNTNNSEKSLLEEQNT